MPIEPRATMVDHENRLAIFTICSNNYMAMAKVFIASVKKFHPEAQCFLCLADDQVEDENFYPEDCTLVTAEELNPPDFYNFMFRYDVMELNTALKPFMFLRLFQQGFQNVLYFDPDIEVFSPLKPILEALDDGASFTLTPHLLAPNESEHYPDDMGIMRAGVYNLGFLGAGRNDQTMNVIHWWARRLTYMCINSQELGVFVDQKFMDLVPGFVDKAVILRQSTLNVAYWNLEQRHLTKDGDTFLIDGHPLIFFHFSGFSASKIKILSKHTNAFRNEKISAELGQLIQHYAAGLIAYAQGLEANRPYTWANFKSGVPISKDVRKLFREKFNFCPGNPFETFEQCLNEPVLDQRLGGYGPKVTHLMMSLKHHAPSLFDPHVRKTSSGQIKIAKWFVAEAESIGIDRRLIEPVAEQLGDRTVVRSAPGKSDQNSPNVNVVGYLQLASGVAESGRQLLRGLNYSPEISATGLAISLNALAPKVDTSCDPWLVEKSSAPIQLLGVNADQVAQVKTHLVDRINKDAYRIMYPYWELSKFPQAWVQALNEVDEIWAPTKFIQSILSHLTDKPVLRMPLALDFAPPGKKPHSAFGLPEDAFLFFFSFDYLSFAERKNPAATLAAFRKAFADKSKYKNVYLVVKTLNSHRVSDAHKKLGQELKSDPNVIMIDQTLSREDVLALVDTSDAVVSLHRGEGLGLLIAEAMVLGKPVISTDYSATTELITPQTGWPVSHKLVALKEGDYPFFEGQRWADPDVEHAAWQMLQVYEGGQDVKTRVANAKLHISTNYSMQTVSQRMHKRIGTILGS